MDPKQPSTPRRLGTGGPASSVALPAGIFLLFAGAAIALVDPELAGWAIGVATAGALALGYALVVNYTWLERTFFHRRFGLSINNLILILAVIGILGMLNFIAYRRNVPYDFTQDRKFSLSDQTLKILDGLTQDIEILAFFIEGQLGDQRGQRASQERVMVQKLLDRYAKSSKKVTYKLIDPEKEPILTKQYEITYNGTTVLKSGDRKVRVETDKMFEYNRSFFSQRLQAFNGEQALTSAILDLTSGTVRTLYFLEGHDERNIDGNEDTGLAAVKEYLLREQYRLEKLSLLKTPQIPANCSVLIVAGSRRNLPPQEVDILDKWMSAGNSVLFLVDLDTPRGLQDLLRKHGIDTGRNIVLEPNLRVPEVFGGSPMIPIPDYATHAIVDPLKEKKRALQMPSCTNLARAAETPESKGFTYHELVKTSPDSWAEVTLDNPRAAFDQGTDVKGPCTLAYAFGKEETPPPPANPMEAKPQEPKVSSRAVVIGSTSFITNAWVERSPNNIDLFVNAVNWLSGETGRISIRPKSEEAPKLEAEVAQYANRILYATMLIIPGFIFALGLYIWWRRSSL
ncbi:MAG: Gldg family protein [Candidatus Riflebacteria bacterium]|nr:Gldg family protein [Candidatus Riflebacteria bacterium]